MKDQVVPRLKQVPLEHGEIEPENACTLPFPGVVEKEPIRSLVVMKHRGSERQPKGKLVIDSGGRRREHHFRW